MTVGSPPTPFSQNKQNEPALAVDANHPNVLVAGANDEIDMEACNAGDDTTCPFTPGVGVSGVYFSFDSGTTWTQPTYTGLSGARLPGRRRARRRAARRTSGRSARCRGTTRTVSSPTATRPSRSARGRARTGFSWANGSRLYYANLTSNFGATRSEQAFKGFEAIAVSRTDDVAAPRRRATRPRGCRAGASSQQAVVDDVLRQGADLGRQRVVEPVLRHRLRLLGVVPRPGEGQRRAGAADRRGLARRRRHLDDSTRSPRRPNNGQRNPLDGCTIRTDSHGSAYVFGVGSVSSQGGKQAFEFMSRSTDGGVDLVQARAGRRPGHPAGRRSTRCRAGRSSTASPGARSDLAPAPSVDIANGAPTGADATNRIVMSYVSGDARRAARVLHRVDRRRRRPGRRRARSRRRATAACYAAPAISPNGTDVYVVYNAFTTPYPDEHRDAALAGRAWCCTPTSPAAAADRRVRRAASRRAGRPARVERRTTLTGEFLGDYVYAVATRTYGAAVWNDTRNAADCPAIDAWRQSLQNGARRLPTPAPQQDCPATFGNSDIFGGSYADPTP